MLPVKFNDGRAIPRKWIGEALHDLTSHFDAASIETQMIEGHWRHAGVLYRDKLVRLFVDVPDLPKHRKWMKQFKARWKARLEQVELWMVSYRIEIE
jgi:hypothetical protein